MQLQKYYFQIIAAAFCVKIKKIDADSIARTDPNLLPAVHVVVITIRIVGGVQCTVVCSYNVITTFKKIQLFFSLNEVLESKFRYTRIESLVNKNKFK